VASSPPKRERRESIFVDPFGRASAIKEMLGTAVSIIFGAPSTLDLVGNVLCNV
jgi:hypothetical protein